MTYIFRFPKGTPTLNYETLKQVAGAHLAKHGYSSTPKIGTTVRLYAGSEEVCWPALNRAEMPPGSEAPAAQWIAVMLYETTIAVIAPHSVTFTVHGVQSHATREWLQAICRDNAIGYRVYSEKGAYYIDSKAMPVEGHYYAAGRR